MVRKQKWIGWTEQIALYLIASTDRNDNDYSYWSGTCPDYLPNHFRHPCSYLCLPIVLFHTVFRLGDQFCMPKIHNVYMKEKEKEAYYFRLDTCGMYACL